MKFIRAILIAICVLIMLVAGWCLLSEIGGGAPGEVYAVQTTMRF